MPKSDIPLEEGKKIAELFIKLTKSFYKRIEICGSIRRKSAVVHDIDLCAIAKKPIKEYYNAVQKAGGRITRFGGEYATVDFYNIQVNVLFVNEETWGAGEMWSTGPKGHTIGMNIKAEQLGFKFNRTGIRRRSDYTIIPTPTEQDIAKLLHWTYKPPEERGKTK